jgi:hypothetical protein
MQGQEANYSRDTINIRDDSSSRDNRNIMDVNSSRTASIIGKSATIEKSIWSRDTSNIRESSSNRNSQLEHWQQAGGRQQRQKEHHRCKQPKGDRHEIARMPATVE